MATPSVDIATITGPLLLGHLFNFMLMGAMSIQVYVYFLSFPKDRMLNKILVTVVFSLDIFQTAVAAHYAWFTLAAGWGNPEVLQVTTWSLALVPPCAGLVAVIVQLFFSWRIWILGSKDRRYIPLLVAIALTALLSCGCSFAAAVSSLKFHYLGQYDLLSKEISIWLSAAMACDVIIAITLVLQLASRKRPGFNINHLIHRAIRMAIETGAFTSIVVVAELIIYYHGSAYYFMFGMSIGKLYSNTFLANLNARSHIFKGSSSDIERGLHIWSSQRDAGVIVNTTTVTSVSAGDHLKTSHIELGDINDGHQNSKPFFN